MKKRVGILTSGGDCPGLNATIRGVAKALYARMGDNVEIVGIANGYSGLINGDYREMNEDDFRGILTLGGTILGTKRTPFKLMRVVEDDNIDKVAAMKKTYKAAKLDCLLCLGGNGTHKTANPPPHAGAPAAGRRAVFNTPLRTRSESPYRAAEGRRGAEHPTRAFRSIASLSCPASRSKQDSPSASYRQQQLFPLEQLFLLALREYLYSQFVLSDCNSYL